MIAIILIIILLIVICMTLLVVWAFSLHLKRFGLPGDPDFKKIFNIFKTGSFILIGLGILFLILNIIVGR